MLEVCIFQNFRR